MQMKLLEMYIGRNVYREKSKCIQPQASNGSSMPNTNTSGTPPLLLLLAYYVMLLLAYCCYCLHTTACLIIRLLFGFVSDSVFLYLSNPTKISTNAPTQIQVALYHYCFCLHTMFCYSKYFCCY